MRIIFLSILNSSASLLYHYIVTYFIPGMKFTEISGGGQRASEIVPSFMESSEEAGDEEFPASFEEMKADYDKRNKVNFTFFLYLKI